jgi:lipoprotein-anchoring transpeptidase ErfK/SrfK
MTKKQRSAPKKRAKAAIAAVKLFPTQATTALRAEHHRHIRAATIALSAVLVFEMLAGFSLFFWQHSYSYVQVSIAGITARRNLDERVVGTQLAKTAASYRLAIRSPDDNSLQRFSLRDMGMEVDTKATLTAASVSQRERAFWRRLEWWRVTPAPLKLRIDRQALAAFIAAHATKNLTPSTNASLSIENGTVTEKDGQDGQQYGLRHGSSSVERAAAELQSDPLTLVKQRATPQIGPHELAGPRTKLETILSQRVTFTIDGHTITSSRADIGSWIELTPVPSARTVDITVNSGKVADYINALAEPYIQPARNQIVAKNSDGTTTVLSAGHNGVDVKNKDALATKVTAGLLDGKGLNNEVPVTYSPYKTVSAQSYPKWIEVDLTAKRLYAYENTTQVRTYLVSAGAPATPTVTGQFAIYSKYVSQTMSGGNADGSRYVQPDVPYVNYFYRDYAIHGNYWRPLSYFGNINSSHGCVGLTTSDSAWIYNWAPIGTPVIIHR